MSVSMMPGRTALTRMPSAATSRARPSVKRVDRALGGRVVDVLAGRAEPRRGRRQVDDRAAARRRGACDMRRTASRAQTKLPKTLIANMRCSRVDAHRSTRAATSTTPALLTSAAERRQLARRSVANIAQHLRLRRRRRPGRARAAAGGADRGRRRACAAARVARVVDRHRPAALRAARRRGRGADAAAAAGDEHGARAGRAQSSSSSSSPRVVRRCRWPPAPSPSCRASPAAAPGRRRTVDRRRPREAQLPAGTGGSCRARRPGARCAAR